MDCGGNPWRFGWHVDLVYNHCQAVSAVPLACIHGLLSKIMSSNVAIRIHKCHLIYLTPVHTHGHYVRLSLYSPTSMLSIEMSY